MHLYPNYNVSRCSVEDSRRLWVVVCEVPKLATLCDSFAYATQSSVSTVDI